MFEKILVANDGSESAFRTLPPASISPKLSPAASIRRFGHELCEKGRLTNRLPWLRVVRRRVRSRFLTAASIRLELRSESF